jgi:quinol monooxygenase YgiN
MDPITIVVHIKAKPENRNKVRRRLLELVNAPVKETGNIFYHLHEAAADPCHFIIYEQWENQAALDRHMQQDYLVAFLNDGSRLLSEEIQGTFCNKISSAQSQELKS